MDLKCVLLSVCLFGIATAAAPDTLRMVNVLYRHGDRSPVTTYPNDPYKGNNFWPQGLGWLSKTGMRQQFALGQWLRSEYGNLLNTTYKNTEIVVEASNVNRCLMSAYCNLAGLYPPVGAQQWNPALPWQPIPVHTRPEIEDNKLAITKPCPRYDELFAQELHSAAVRHEEQVNANFYSLVDREAGLKSRENISEVWKVSDTLFCENAHNLTLPAWTEKVWDSGTVYDYLMVLKDWGFTLLFNGTELSRLKGGPLLKEFIHNMEGFASEPATHNKMYMYSAHDTTVAAVTGALSVNNRRSPPYATAVLVELHQSEDNSYCVQIRFRNESTSPPFDLQHPDCDEMCCPLDKFVEVTKPRVPVDWEAECRVSQDGTVAREHVSGSAQHMGTSIGFVALCVAAVILITVLSIAYLRQRRIVKTFETV